MKSIIIYSKIPCPYCIKAKNYFKENGLAFKEIDVTDNPTLIKEMIEKSHGRKTVPQIFIADRHIGGWDDMNALIQTGALKKILEN